MKQKSKLHRIVIATTLLLTLGAASAWAAPPISADQAAKIALARVPGKVMHEKLKKADKHGKKTSKNKMSPGHDHYNVKINPQQPAKGQWKRVEVDAVTGAILEIKDVKAKSYSE